MSLSLSTACPDSPPPLPHLLTREYSHAEANIEEKRKVNLTKLEVAKIMTGGKSCAQGQKCLQLEV